MQHSVSPESVRVPVRWGVVVRIVLAVCLAAIIIFAIWYAAAIAMPQAERANTNRALESYELQSLSARMLRVETMLHLH
jgi:uncharacterized ion transporter superfamily protein YfcC